MENIKWLWSIMDKKYRKWHILALCLSALTSVGLLINPTLQKQLVDEVIVAKNRHGETGTVKLQWFGQYQMFTDREWKHAE